MKLSSLLALMALTAETTWNATVLADNPGTYDNPKPIGKCTKICQKDKKPDPSSDVVTPRSLKDALVEKHVLVQAVGEDDDDDKKRCGHYEYQVMDTWYYVSTCMPKDSCEIQTLLPNSKGSVQRITTTCDPIED